MTLTRTQPAGPGLSDLQIAAALSPFANGPVMLPVDAKNTRQRPVPASEFMLMGADQHGYWLKHKGTRNHVRVVFGMLFVVKTGEDFMQGYFGEAPQPLPELPPPPSPPDDFVWEGTTLEAYDLAEDREPPAARWRGRGMFLASPPVGYAGEEPLFRVFGSDDDSEIFFVGSRPVTQAEFRLLPRPASINAP